MEKDEKDTSKEDALVQLAAQGCLLEIVAFIATAIIAVICLTSCCTCKPTPIYNDRDSTGTHYEWKIDTIKEVDSVFVSIREKGDTVYVDKYKYVYRYKTREVEVHDTTTVVEKETVEVPVDVVKEVPRKKSWFDKTQQYGFWLLLALWGVRYRNRILKAGMKFLE